MPDATAAKTRIYTVSELTKGVKFALEGSFGHIWVEGEVSNFISHSSGHMYFSLKDAKSVIRCAMFKRANDSLKFRPKDGMQAICFGNVSVYELRGDYQLIVEKMEPKGRTRTITRGLSQRNRRLIWLRPPLSPFSRRCWHLFARFLRQIRP